MNAFQHQEHDDGCYDLSIFIARRDNELPADEAAKVEQHLTTCGDCAADDHLITSSGSEIYTLLSALDPEPSTMSDLVTARAKLEARLSEAALPKKSVPVRAGEDEPRPYRKKTTRIWRQLRRNWVAVMAAAVLLALLILPNASALANQFLSLFRVHQFQLVSIDPREIASPQLP